MPIHLVQDSAFGTEQKQLVNTSVLSEGSAGGNDETLNKTHDVSNVADDSLKNESSGTVNGQQQSDKPQVSTIEESVSKEVEEEVVEEVMDGGVKQGELVSSVILPCLAI